MSSHSSAISALASSLTYDQYSSWTGERDPAKLLRVGRIVSFVWGTALVFAALGFFALTSGTDTPVVVLALSIASVTYGALLGVFLLSGMGARMQGRDVLRATGVTMIVMLITIFASRLSGSVPALTGLGRLAFPWYVPMGTAITVGVALISSRIRPASVPVPA